VRLLKLSCKFQDASCKKKQKAGVGGSGFVVGKSTLNQKKLPCEAGIAITDALIGGGPCSWTVNGLRLFPSFSGT